MSSHRVTRGSGTLENWLAKQRCHIAQKLIPSNSRAGRLLDIGCGTRPYFLLHTEFAEKHGLDKTIDAASVDCSAGQNISLRHYDIEKENLMPFDEHSFDVITMLAVMEHIEPDQLVGKLMEIHRILKPGGIFIATTPAAWSDGLLKGMARINLVSAEEIQEHKAAYTHQKLRYSLHSAGFGKQSIQCGYFEFYLNLWVTAMK